MADTKLVDLTALTTPDKDDPVYTVDDPGGTPVDRKITWENVFKVLNTFTADTSPATSDVVYVYDVSGGVSRKVTIANLVAAAPHTHAASDITSGTLTHERGGLEADVSAYAGLVEITGGATAAVTISAFGKTLIDDADATAARTTLGAASSAEVTALTSGYSRRKKVINHVDNTAAPPSEVSGDRYILDDTGSSHADWDGAAANDIVEFNGTTWDATTPTEGWIVYNDTDNLDWLFVDDGSPAWQSRATGAGISSLNGETDASQTFSNDTNVTISSASGVHTVGWTGSLAVARGGTGATTLTDGGILLGSGTGAVTAMSVLATGEIVVGDGTTDPIALAALDASNRLKHEYGGIEADISSGDGFVQVKSGAGSVIKTNHAGTTAPTATDDSGSGYAVGSRWIDTTNDKEYVCLDATTSAAVWTETTGAGGGGGGLSNVVEDTTPQLGGNLDCQGSDITDVGVLQLQDSTELTLSSGGSIGVSQSVHRVDTFGDAATDDVESISGGVDGRVVVFFAENDTRTVVFKHTSGAINCIGDADISLDNNRDFVLGVHHGGAWTVGKFGGGGGGGLSNVVDDTTPQLGGTLDVNGNAIGDGTEAIQLDGGPYSPVETIADGATGTADLSKSNVFKWTLPASDDSRTLAFSNAQVGMRFVVRIDASSWNSGFTATWTWPSNLKWPGGMAPDPASDVDDSVYEFIYYGSTDIAAKHLYAAIS